jgi:hypothetical protein
MKVRLAFYGALILVLTAGTWLVVFHARPAKILGQTSNQTNSSAPARYAQVPATQSEPATSQKSVQPPSPIDTVMDAQADYGKRLSAIDALPRHLTDFELQALYDFLREKTPADDGQLGQVLKNKLLDFLCAMSPPPSGLLDVLGQLYQDRDQNVVIRDYAIQHLTVFYGQVGNAAGMDPLLQSTDLKQARTLLWQAVSETDSSIAGTALLGLTRLSQQGWTDVDGSKVGSAALKLAGDGSASELSRITAFQVCAKLGVADALPLALGSAQEGDTIPLRISAIGALGALGGEDQIPLLSQLIQENNDRLKLPAQHALNQINQRLNEQANSD